MAAQFDGRWFQRADGVVFRMDDPDHITRMLAEGWHEVNGPHSSLAATDVIDDDALHAAVEALEADTVRNRNSAARAAFGTEPKQPQPAAKPIKRVRTHGQRS